MSAYERKYVKLCGIIAEAKVLHDWNTMIGAKYDLACLKEEMGV